MGFIFLACASIKALIFSISLFSSLFSLSWFSESSILFRVVDYFLFFISFLSLRSYWIWSYMLLITIFCCSINSLSSNIMLTLLLFKFYPKTDDWWLSPKKDPIYLMTPVEDLISGNSLWVDLVDSLLKLLLLRWLNT